MIKRLNLLQTVTSCLLAATVSVSVSPAYAGFEWNPPAAKAHSSGGPDVPASPADKVDVMELAPVTASPVPAFPVEERRPVAASASAFSQDAAYASIEQGTYEIVEGFGKDIPLALAMTQIVPSSYSYSFDQGIDLGSRISWDSGEPWNTTLDSALSTHGLKLVVVDKAAWVRKQGTADMQPADSVPMPVDSQISPVPSDSAMTAMPEAPLPDDTISEEPSLEPPAMTVTPIQSYPRRQKPAMTSEQKQRSHDKLNMSSTTDTLSEEEVSAAIPLDLYEPAAADSTTPSRFSDSGKRKADFDPYEIQYWTANTGQELKDVLAIWSDKAGVDLVWNTDRNYKIPAFIGVHATFPDAVTRILAEYGQQTPRPSGKLHTNLTEGPAVLLIENQG